MSNKSTAASFYRVFSVFDADKDGKLSPADLKALFKKLGRDLTDEQVADVQGFILGLGSTSTDLDFTKFMSWLDRVSQSGGLQQRMEGIFEVMDSDKDGKISANDICKIASKIGVDADASAVRQLFPNVVDVSQFGEAVGRALPK